ncbi:MAG: hypothetical protein WBX25_37360 [Rhodomicrobium sp.]
MLRAYGEPPHKERSSRRKPLKASGFELIFDTETTVGAAQRLRFGVYQVRHYGFPFEQGIFYHPTEQCEGDIDLLKDYARRHDLKCMAVENFVRERFLEIGYDNGGPIIGFNLPFDISRLAIGQSRARKVVRTHKKTGKRIVDRSMVGGFTFKLLKGDEYPHVRVKHLSRRAAFINFALPAEQAVAEKTEVTEARIAERGTFIDVKTLAAALTSKSHSLRSLANTLGVKRKGDYDEFELPLTEDFINYAVRDVEVTAECYDALKARYESHGLTLTPPQRIYSEAGLGKAYLRQMGVKPWREVQPDFDPRIIGAMMSSYFGGRAEVHIRREIMRAIYCDFASMYPTVCTLMGLWRFVIANGIDVEDATKEVRAFLDQISLEQLQSQDTWQQLHVLVKVKPDADIFPVRAHYSKEPIPNIGLNYLSADSGFWFTLADCIASKLLTGKVPKVLEALRFTPRDVQDDLKPVNIAGNPAFRVDPNRTDRTNDFYKRVIDRRREVKTELKRAEAAKDRARARELEGEQLALKILANATSYGIFIELNVEDMDEDDKPFEVHAGQGSFTAKPKKREEPGEYFHPLLATLITGAARLMMAITESLIREEQLDWAFCDTDGIAIALPKGQPEDGFEGRVQKIRAWFEDLNPYDAKGSILDLEDENKSQETGELVPLYCFAVSAKRYALFNRGPDGELVIRKASAHGLGHLIAPYKEEPASKDETEQDEDEEEDDEVLPSGVELWQEDLWRAIIKAAEGENPRHLAIDWHDNLEKPAASRYSATKPIILDWFKTYNKGLPYDQQVKPFNFLLMFQAEKNLEKVFEDGKADWNPREREPKPTAPYDKDPRKALSKLFDRDTGEPVMHDILRNYGQALRQYHLHPEAKFLQGRQMDSGLTLRRHVFVDDIDPIGKEANEIEEDETFGADEGSTVTYGFSEAQRARMIAAIAAAPKRELAKLAHVSDHTTDAALQAEVSDRSLQHLYEAALKIEDTKKETDASREEVVAWLQTQSKMHGSGQLAQRLEWDHSNLCKVLAGDRKPPKRLVHRVRAALSEDFE